MYNEDNLVIDKFIKNFQSDFGKKIVLYGTGKNTKKLLEHIDGELIDGIMDIGKSGQVIYGRKILSEQEVLDIMPDCIVLICMPSTEEVVYHHIKKFCEKNRIKVYNLDRVLLNDFYTKKADIFEILNGADTPMKKTIASLFFSRLSGNGISRGTDGKIGIQNSETLGYLFWGPLFMGYMIWMMKGALRADCDLILFQARDGYLLEKIYRKITAAYPEINFPEEKYFLTSRRASMVPGIRMERDIVVAAEYSYHGTREDFLKTRFGIDEIGEVDASLLKCALKRKEQIFFRAELERKNYMRYMEKVHITEYKKAALIDVTAAGTIQTNLEHFMPIELKGFYFLKRKSVLPENNQICVESYYESKGAYEITDNIFAYFRMMEVILASQEPSLVCFDEYGNPVYGEDIRARKEKDLILRIQDEILHYAEDFLKLHLKWEELQEERDYCDEILGFMKHDYVELQNDEMSTLMFEDSFSATVGKACEQL